jgi:hypothetical protein
MKWYEIVLFVIVWIGALWLYGYLRENNSFSNYNKSWKKKK